jgi:acetate kinase
MHWWQAAVPQRNIVAAGHRVVHRGVEFSHPVAVTDAAILKLLSLIPLHAADRFTGFRLH